MLPIEFSKVLTEYLCYQLFFCFMQDYLLNSTQYI